MQRAFDQFKNSIKYVKELDVLYNYLKNDLHLPDDSASNRGNKINGISRTCGALGTRGIINH